jgi:lysyl endopeptidase
MTVAIRPVPLLVSLLAVTLALPAAADSGLRVGAEPYRPELDPMAAMPKRWQSAGVGAPPASARMHLLPLGPDRVDAIRAANAQAGTKRLRIGVERDPGSEVANFDAGNLAWQPVPGGWLASVEVVVPDAAAVRVAVPVDGLPEGAWLRFGGDVAGQASGADIEEMRAATDALGRFWTATTSGGRQHLLWFVPGDADITTVPVPRVAGVAHLLVDPHEPDVVAKALGASGSCNIDVVCRTGPLGNLFVQAKNSVAHMVFQDGGTYVCTGTLLNDTDNATQRKWFYSARHCIASQSVANTLETYWFYETPTCNVNNAGQNIRVTGGADLRYATADTDALLLELRGTLPNGVTFAGWDSNALQANAEVTAIHHPAGDIKKVSFGRYLREQANVNLGGSTITSSWRVTWNEGTTEGGSSGSGLFTRDSNSYYLRGGLIGGAASCGNSGAPENSGNYDYYSRFDHVFPDIRQYLAPASGGTPGATRDYTGQWYNANQARRGLSLFRLNNGGLFSLWFRYDAQNRPTWYQLEDIWTGPDRMGGRVARFSGNSSAPVFTGTYTLVFNSATSATFTYTNVDGSSGTINLTRGTP